MAETIEGPSTKRIFSLLAAVVAAFFCASSLAPTGPSAQTTSPVNGKIVYVKRDTAPGEHLNDIWVMNADGSGQTNLTNTPEVGEAQPAFSFDGTRIVFNGPGDENAEGDGLSDI